MLTLFLFAVFTLQTEPPVPVSIAELERVDAQTHAWTQENTSADVMAAVEDLRVAILRIKQRRQATAGPAIWPMLYGPWPSFPGEGETPILWFGELDWLDSIDVEGRD